MGFIEELFEEIESLDVVEEFKKEEKKDIKLKVVFEATDDRIKDNKEHFPLVNEEQAKTSLLKSLQYKRSPRWFNGTLKELKKVVAETVKKEFPSIESKGKE